MKTVYAFQVQHIIIQQGGAPGQVIVQQTNADGSVTVPTTAYARCVTFEFGRPNETVVSDDIPCI